ncbi:MAG: hypothetical protein OHK0045_24140 [Raineya sp.]
MNKEKTRLKLSDLIDFASCVGGFGFLFTIIAQQNISPIGLLILLGSSSLGALGLARLVGKKKQKRINELENLLNTHLPELLEKSSHSTNNIAKKSALGSNTEDLEVNFLEALVLQKGRITLTEAVILTRTPIDRVMRVVENLQEKGVIGTEVSESGQIVYTNAT